MTEASAVICDGCGDRVPGLVGAYPAGWLRLHAWGRRRGSAMSVKVAAVDACPKPGCAQEALSNAYNTVRPTVAEGRGDG